MTPEQYRAQKNDLIRREHSARAKAQLAAVAVDDAKATGDEEIIEEAMFNYRVAVAALEELMHMTGEYD